MITARAMTNASATRHGGEIRRRTRAGKRRSATTPATSSSGTGRSQFTRAREQTASWSVDECPAVHQQNYIGIYIVLGMPVRADPAML